MKIKTSTLTGLALDWAVEVAKGTHWSGNGYFIRQDDSYFFNEKTPEYSNDWLQGGQIIQREGIQLHVNEDKTEWLGSCWGYPAQQYGPTPLIAAMRCFVASKLGDEVDIPKEIWKVLK